MRILEFRSTPLVQQRKGLFLGRMKERARLLLGRDQSVVHRIVPRSPGPD